MKEHPAVFIRFFIKPFFFTKSEFIYNRQIKKFPTEKQNVSLKHILT